jgi:predicted outer membrane lipoprotein
VRINIAQQDRRTFAPTSNDSPSWRRGYHRRSALERINNRIDPSFGFERHFIRGQAKMQTRVGLALAVMTAMALRHVKAGRTKQVRSLVRPLPATG